MKEMIKMENKKIKMITIILFLLVGSTIIGLKLISIKKGEEVPLENVVQTTTKKVFVPRYFEFGFPTIDSTTDYKTLGKKVFATLSADGTTNGLCIDDDGLFCLSTKNYKDAVTSLKAHFGEANCSYSGANFDCTTDNFSCYVFSYGDLHCSSYSPDGYCFAGKGGTSYCG